MVERFRDTLAGFARPAARRVVLAGVLGVLTYVTVAGGVVVYWPQAQVALVVAMVVALVAPSALAAGGVATAVYAAGVLIGPENFWLLGSPAVSTGELLPWAVGAGLGAAGFSAVVRARWIGPQLLFWAAIAVVLVNTWATVFVGNGQPIQDSRTGLVVPALTQLIEGADAPAGMRRADDYFYLIVDAKLRAGEPYYSAAAGSFDEVGDGSVGGPAGVFNLRQPLLYWVLAALPRASWVYAAHLTLVSAVAVSVAWALRDVVRAPVILPAVFAIASYDVPFSTSLQLFYSDLWAGYLAVLAFSCLAVSLRSPVWRRWLAASVVVSAVAFLVREFAASLLVAGALAAWLGPAERRRWSLGAWGAGLAVAIAGYVLHVRSVLPFVTGAPGQGVWGRGGVEFALAGLSYNTLVFGAAWAAVLALLGYVGAASLPDSAPRAFALSALVVPIVAFLFLGNGATDTLTGAPVNYWGMNLVPLAYACMPAALAVLPGSVPLVRLS